MNMDINVGVHVDMYKNKIIPVQYNRYIYVYIHTHGNPRNHAKL